MWTLYVRNTRTSWRIAEFMAPYWCLMSTWRLTCWPTCSLYRPPSLTFADTSSLSMTSSYSRPGARLPQYTVICCEKDKIKSILIRRLIYTFIHSHSDEWRQRWYVKFLPHSLVHFLIPFVSLICPQAPTLNLLSTCLVVYSILSSRPISFPSLFLLVPLSHGLITW